MNRRSFFAAMAGIPIGIVAPAAKASSPAPSPLCVDRERWLSRFYTNQHIRARLECAFHHLRKGRIATAKRSLGLTMRGVDAALDLDARRVDETGGRWPR